MATLKPYHYYSGSSTYQTGWPTSSLSAMYTAYANWAMMPIYHNDNNYPIKINSVKIKFGINSGSAKAKIFYAVLGSSIVKNTKFKSCSDEFTVPKTTSLSEATNCDLNTELIIPAKSYFAIGFKANRTSGSGRLSVARTNTKNKAKSRTFYNGQSMDNSFSSFSLNRIATNDIWSWQIPAITIDYSIYEIKPVVSYSNVSVTQGNSTEIAVSGYDNWSIKSVSESLSSNGVSVTKKGNSINISTGIGHYSSNLTGTIVVQGLNSTTDIDVTVVRPSIKSINVTKTTIRPMESVTFSCSTTGAIFESNYPSNCVNVSNSTTFTAIALTEDEFNKLSKESNDWVRGTYENAIKGKFIHPLNNTVTVETSVSLSHYESNDINISFSTSSAFGNVSDTTNPYIKYYDNTITYGGSNLYIDSEKVNIDNKNKIIYIISNDECTLSFTARLNIDHVVTKTYENALNIKSSTPLSFNGVDDNNTNWVGIGVVDYDNIKEKIVLRFNPVCYPLKITFPNNLDASKNITITNLRCDILNINVDDKITTKSESPIYVTQYNLEDDPIDVKSLIKSNDLNGNTYFVSNDLKEISIPLDEIFLSESYYHQVIWENFIGSLNGQVVFDLNYHIQDSDETQTVTIKKFIDIIVNKFIPLYKNYYYDEKYERHNVVGSKLELDSNPVKAINSMSPIIRSINDNYMSSLPESLLLNLIEEGKIITANKDDIISNSYDKLAIETYLTMLNSFIRNLNDDSSNKHINLNRKTIALNQPIMWDDLNASFENIRTQTASPWKELFNSIYNIHFDDSKKYNIVFKTYNKETQSEETKIVGFGEKLEEAKNLVTYL